MEAMDDRDGAIGTGIDLVDQARVKQAIEEWGDRFIDKVFLPRERAYCESKAHPWRHFAGRFAVKEAVSKAFGTGIGQHIGWKDIEIVSGPRGAPEVILSPEGRAYAARRGVGRIMVSLSHASGYTVAQALLVR